MKSEAVMSGVRKPHEVPPPCWRYRVLTWIHCVMKATQVNYVQSLMRGPDSQWNQLSIPKSHNRSLTRVEFQFLVITAEYHLFGILPLIPFPSFLSSLPFSSFLPPSILSSLILLSLKYMFVAVEEGRERCMHFYLLSHKQKRCSVVCMKPVVMCAQFQWVVGKGKLFQAWNCHCLSSPQMVAILHCRII